MRSEHIAEVMTEDEARRVHPSKLDMRWARYTDHGPPEWEGYTFMGYQNYGNQFDENMSSLLWVRLKKDLTAAKQPTGRF